MTPDSDDLEQALQQNLEIRRELGAELGKVDGIRPAKQGGGIVYRLGWVLYWACLVLAAGWAAMGIFAGIQRPSNWSDSFFYLYFGGPALVAYGLGRAFRYVLAGE